MRIAYALEDGIARITLDDGKANAMSVPWFEEFGAALDRAEADAAGALIVHGRERIFSGGLDLKLVPTLDPAGLQELFQTFARTMLRLYALPIPTVACAAGHAIAGGAVLAFACDARFATQGPFKIQMNEVAIGIPLPVWMLVIGESAIAPTVRNEALLHARAYTPDEALARGIVDGLGESPEATAKLASERARSLLPLNRAAYAESKRRLRAPALSRALASLEGEEGGR